MNVLNRWLDGLPVTRVGIGAREAPTYRTCGIAGYYLAVILTMGAGLVGRRSLLALAGVSAVCALSFFAWALARRAVTGREEIVLLEHVWFAEACSAVFLTVIHVPVLAHLDAVAVGLCGFLAAGRVGCLLAGCCHGRPSSIGIVYHACVSPHLSGVRLFPVPAIEALGLAAIGLTGLVALPFARPGEVMAWFLIAYAVLRFGLEGLRGDARPHLLGLSQARWMAIAEAGVAIAIVEGRRGTLDLSPRTILPAALLLALLVAAATRWLLSRERRLVSLPHREEALAAWLDLRRRVDGTIRVHRTSADLTLAVSRTDGDRLHLSVSLPTGPPDLALLCELAAPLVPRARVAHAAPGPVLHLIEEREMTPDPAADGRRLYGEAALLLQQRQEPSGTEEAGTAREAYFIRR